MPKASDDRSVVPFLFEDEKLVRVVWLDGLPWFVGRDVAAVLGYKDTAKAISTHCKRAIAIAEGVGDSPTLGGRNQPFLLDPQTKIIPEGDVFRLIVRSTLPAAERFEVWVMETLLPTIRRTGGFDGKNDAKLPDDRPWRARSIEERMCELRVVELLGRNGNKAAAFLYMINEAKVMNLPKELMPAWQQTLDLGVIEAAAPEGGLH